MPFIIALLILIILLLVFGPIILLILALFGISVAAVLAWVVSKLFWIVLGVLALGCVLTIVMYCVDPKGFAEAMKQAEADQKRRDAFKASYKNLKASPKDTARAKRDRATMDALMRKYKTGPYKTD